MRDRIQIVVWNSKGHRFEPYSFEPTLAPNFEVKFVAKFQYSGHLTQWGWRDSLSLQERRFPLEVDYPGWFGGEVTIVSSVYLLSDTERATGDGQARSL